MNKAISLKKSLSSTQRAQTNQKIKRRAQQANASLGVTGDFN